MATLRLSGLDTLSQARGTALSRALNLRRPANKLFHFKAQRGKRGEIGRDTAITTAIKRSKRHNITTLATTPAPIASTRRTIRRPITSTGNDQTHQEPHPAVVAAKDILFAQLPVQQRRGYAARPIEATARRVSAVQ